MGGSSRFSRAPRRPVEIMKSERLDTQRRVHADPRFRRLLASARCCLTVAVMQAMDGEGKWWLKVRDWARLADCSESTLKRAILAAERVGLIRTVPYLRPDGKQGSSTYWLDPPLLARLPDEPPCGEPPPVDQSGSSPTSSSRRSVLFDSGGSRADHLVEADEQGGSPADHLADGQAGPPTDHLVDDEEEQATAPVARLVDGERLFEPPTKRPDWA
jgi:hypothetical protein